MIAFFRSRSIVRMTVRPRTCGYTRVPYQKRLRGITNSPLSMRPFPFDFDTCTYLSFPSLIALRISISTLTAGYLILASDDNIGVCIRCNPLLIFGQFPCYTRQLVYIWLQMSTQHVYIFSLSVRNHLIQNPLCFSMNEIQSTVNPIDQVLIHTSRDCDNFQLSIRPGS